MQVPDAEDSADEATDGVEDQVPHRVRERRHVRRALRVRAEDSIDGELPDLPRRAEAERQPYGDADGHRGADIEPARGAQDVQAEEAERGEHRGVAEVEHLVEVDDAIVA